MSWIMYIFISECHIEVIQVVFVCILLIKIGTKIMPDKNDSIISLYIYFSVLYILLSHTNLKPQAIYFKSIKR